jgi:microcystin-dependent protein
MGSPFIGEVRMFGGNFAPAGWSLCGGQLMPINQNAALFALIGTTYGGDGVSTFGLPNLFGRVPIHQGGTFVIGQLAGTETVTLVSNQLPVHTHSAGCTDGNANKASPQGSIWASEPNGITAFYTSPSVNPVNTQMNAGSISQAGGSQPHPNMQPSLAINFIISLFGIFPSRN